MKNTMALTGLFYLYKNRVIPKTRLAPIASGKIQQIIKLPEFPINEIDRMVRDGYIPIFEVWGSVLEKYNILHGLVNYNLLEELDDYVKPLNVSLIAVMKADYDNYDYKFLSPDKIIKLANDYDLSHSVFRGKYVVSIVNINKLMNEAELLNHSYCGIVTEGYVAHCCDEKLGYSMFKIKPYTIMTKDVISTNTIPIDRIKLEISKVMVETDILEITKNPVEYIRQVIDYLAEDYKLTKRHKKKINRVFIETIASEFVKQYPEVTEPWKLGIHQMFIGEIKRIKHDT